jgi:putative peptide zinc metalloprotease protein
MALRRRKPDFDLSSELEFEEHAPQLRVLKPRMRPDTDIVAQKFGGKDYYVLQDPVTLQFYRVAGPEREIIEQFDGETTLGEIHERLRGRYGASAPSFRDLAGFVFMLRHANLATCEGSEDMRWAVERAGKKRRRQVQQKLTNFMYLTIPLVDPERFLSAGLPYVRWVFSKPFFVVWLATVGSALVAFAYNAPALLRPVNGVLAPSNLPFLWLSFVLIKAFHELGHGFAAKHHGAEVHRMGIMFLVFMPVMYVDATPVWAFPRKWPKVFVGAAGVMTELFIASLALFGWLALDPGALRTVLFNMIFIASVSTVLFNGNPLLRYDAYYVLADLIEIPNLRQRSTEYFKYLGRRYLFGERVPPSTDRGREKRWFLSYGVLATIYRCFIVTSIILFVASKLFFVGVAIATGVAVLWVVTPLVKLIRHVFFARETRHVRLRAVAVFTLVVAGLVGLLGMLPLAASVRAPCALEPHEQVVLRAKWPGFVSEVNVRDGDAVYEGQVLAVLANEELDTQITSLELDVASSRARLRRFETAHQAAAQAEAFRLGMLQQDLATLQERKGSLTVRAPLDGRVVAPDLERTAGRFLALGEELFTVAALDRLRVTVVVDNADVAALLRRQDATVRIKFGSRPDSVYEGSVERIHPAATQAVPPMGLTGPAGGPVLLDPEATGEPRALVPWYRVDVALAAEGSDQPPVWSTGTARFSVGREPLGVQFWLRFRRMLHRRFLI